MFLEEDTNLIFSWKSLVSLNRIKDKTGLLSLKEFPFFFSLNCTYLISCPSKLEQRRPREEGRAVKEERRRTWERWMSPDPAVHHLRSYEGWRSGRMRNPYKAPLHSSVKVKSYWGKKKKKKKQGKDERNEGALPGGKDEQVRLDIQFSPSVKYWSGIQYTVYRGLELQQGRLDRGDSRGFHEFCFEGSLFSMS